MLSDATRENAVSQAAPDLTNPMAPVGVPAPDSMTLAAFLIASIIAGANAVAVRIGLAELAPFWGAGVRFAAAAAILIVAGVLLRRTFPTGRALLGAVLYGLLSFGFTYMFLYWALQEATAGTVMVAFAVAPLLTLILAIVQRLERFTYRGLAGALIAGIGIAIVFADQMVDFAVDTCCDPRGRRSRCPIDDYCKELHQGRSCG
jgi:drug/metabolite transporter (DMT)-like permease